MSQQERNLAFGPEEEPAPPQGKSWFFGVGVNTYQHFPSLNNARKDIEDILQLLQQRYQLDESITLLDEAASRQAIIDQLYALQGRLKENDKLILFYSGHGHLDSKDRGYWIPADAFPRQVSSYIPSSTIQYLVEDIGCRHILLISDSCFSGALLTRDVGYAQQALEELERDRSRWVIASGRQREPVADGKPGENSPFAGSILKVLRDNQQMRLNAGLLYDQVAKLTRFQYKQMPQSAALYSSGHEGGQYVFHLKANEAADWKACQEAGTLAAYQAFVARYPEGMYAQAARATLAELEEEAAWEEARAKGTILSYYQYNRSYPSGKYRTEALEALKRLEEEQGWQQAQRTNTLSAFLDYQGRYPKGRFAQEAEEKIQAILAGQQEPAAWQAAKSKDTAAAYEAYLQQYPQGLHAREARAAAQELQRKAGAERAQQEEAERRQQQAEAERQRREQELEAWQAAKGKGTVVAYEAYLQQYPQGPHTPEARAAVQELQRKAGAERAQQEEAARRQKQEAAQPKAEEAVNPPLSQAMNRRKWLPIAIGVLAGLLAVWGIVKWVGGGKEPEAASTVQYGSVTLGSRAYRTVDIDGLSWMAENLDYEVPDSWCYDNKPGNCDQYGRLYTWEAAKKACAAVGWRLPTDAEWKSLANAYGGYYDSVNSKDVGNPKQAYSALIKGGSTGFSALLGGWRNTDGSFNSHGDDGDYWSATETSGSSAWDYNFNRSNGKMYRNIGNTASGFACRCVKGGTPKSQILTNEQAIQVPPEETEEPEPKKTTPNSPEMTSTFRGEELKVVLSKGTPPYTLMLLRNGKEVFRKELPSAGSHKITLTEYRKDPGSYELRVEDAGSQQASETIRIDPPKEKKAEPATSPGTSGTARLGGRAYRTVRLNGKTWMAENLNYEVPDSWCYGDKSSNCSKYGRLYTWEAAKKACAAVGWRLPTDAEWSALRDKYGGETGAYKALVEGGSTGFSALLGGYRYTGGSFHGLGSGGYYWSATEYGTDNAWGYSFYRSNGQLYRSRNSRSLGFSCRCAQD
ncbi:MAG: caspase family protein [Lewinellaceae bacterium]|nr:caspase family protein [Lewinellaceae bacterium]